MASAVWVAVWPSSPERAMQGENALANLGRRSGRRHAAEMTEGKEMFEVVVLICSLNLAPGECRAETALDVVRGPVVANEIMCGLHGQAYIAPTSLPRRSAGEYVKLQCRRVQDRADALPRGQATPVATGTQ